MASPISLVKSNQLVLKLQSFHNKKVRAREKVDELWSQFHPRYKPKTRLCLQPILKKFKKVRDYDKHHNDDCATFRSNPRFQESFGFFRSEQARKNEKVFDLFDREAKDSVKSPPFLDFDCMTDTTKDLVSGFPVSDCNFIGMEKKVDASKLWTKEGEDSLLCDQTFDIASLKLGFHKFTHDKGGTNIQRHFHWKSLTILESDCKNGEFQVFILEIHVSNVEFEKAKLLSSRALYLFEKMSNSGYILDIKLGYHMSIHNKCGTNFLSNFESIDLLASCKDSDFCVVFNRSIGYYYKGIHDNGGTTIQRLSNSKSIGKVETILAQEDASISVVLILQLCYHKGICDKGRGLPKDKIWKNHSRIFSAKQMEELALGLKGSGLHFLWVIRESKRSKLCDGIVNSAKEQGLFVTNGNRIISRASGGHFKAQIGVKENKQHKEAYLETNGNACGFPPPPKLGYLDLPKKTTSKTGKGRNRKLSSANKLVDGKHLHSEGSLVGTENLVQDLEEEFEMKITLQNLICAAILR
ncbi:uncharacterized protein LOC126617035 [Malus sylvestris]|uniref:uncharacterized protein LOC126617035 n=1 Tax=Malus sylvestris TaxID=3752 RepID=UPI0021AC8855|nr:uncharacterized protein LOC126617035 [Malus sylvestris]